MCLHVRGCPFDHSWLKSQEGPEKILQVHETTFLLSHVVTCPATKKCALPQPLLAHSSPLKAEAPFALPSNTDLFIVKRLVQQPSSTTTSR